MARILITGANGLVGSHLADKFVSQGHEVRCLVHKNLTWIKNLEVELCYGDITQPETLPAAVENIDYVFHSAAVLRAVKPETYYRINRGGTKNLVESVYKYNPGIKGFVYISSHAAMGPSGECKAKKINSSCTPVSDYGKSKLLGEDEVLKYKDKMPVVILRPSAIYGPRDKDLLPLFRFASFGIFPVLTGNGGCVVQLLYVKDLIEICNMIIKRDRLNNTVYFISGENHYTWKEISNIFAGTLNKKVTSIALPRLLVNTAAYLSENFMKLKGKPAVFNRQKVTELCQMYWLGDTTTVNQEFRYEFTPLDIGAKITYDWYRENNWL
jgi:nucleoside-diphosphate-sugar epimerase